MIETNSQTVVAYFDSQSDAEEAVRELLAAGFRAHQIGSSYEDYDSYSSDTQTTSASRSGDAAQHHESFWERIKDFFGGESEHGGDQDHQRWSDRALNVPARYRDRLDNGGGLVSVEAGNLKGQAEQILRSNGGEIDEQFASESSNWQAGQGTRADITGGTVAESADYDRTRNVANRNLTTDQNTNALRDENPERRIQLISEVLRVRKERVARGEVRLRKEVRTETQNIAVPVTREEIVIDRTPVAGERTASGDIGEQEIRVPLSEERVQVEKVPVVTEEVRVGKRAVSNTQNVSDQVRREELNVEGADEETERKINNKKRIA